MLFSNINFSLQGGEVIQLIGRNGSGKTSLLRILSTLSKPETGDIFWNEQNIENDNEAYRNNFSYLDHYLALNAHLTATQNLIFHQAIKSGIEERRLQKALTTLNIEKYADYQCGHLSSGIQKRIALARLLSCDTPLWLLDEPANALDQQGIQLLQNILSDKLSSGGMIIFSSHLPLDLSHPIKTVLIEGNAEQKQN